MTFKKSSRAGLVALASGFCSASSCSVATYRTLSTRRRSAAGLPHRRPATRRRRADAKKPLKCSPNSGDTAWMLTSVALVLMMTIPGLGAVLRRHGAQEERRRHRDDELRHHLPGHDPLAGLHLQLAFTAGSALHRRVSTCLPARHPERYLDGHRQSQSAGGDHPRNRLSSASR